ncbi:MULTISPECIES: hypothetical protein [unclassified Bradyrhizobium]|uniref:hypothetical protein n=1 Tax=unclassified Bradyrhizobium TaxID=2631580 RepID=UPI002478EEC3|nr:MULTISPECIES: hypothetical protein [unclassified Bradyrhizobium]WGR68178.1 hypothetical protein MTX24_22285 [Bradyrhizobium sp. ISRA426]WGR80233.1 hypothetical protein MTX21_07400 [Bradyrhizobium sp. ISRA430]WGR83418.1 hypothetical protein MTX25_21965 [Bradyrhizobium sp. ISRA432]
MDDRRSLLVAVSCPSAVVVGWLALSLSAYAPALIESSGADAAAEIRAKSSAANVERADVPQAAVIDAPAAASADVAVALPPPPSTETAATETATTPDTAEPAVKLASADPAQILPAEAPPPAVADIPAQASSESAPAQASNEAVPAEAPAIKLASSDPTEIVPDGAPLSPAAIESAPAASESKATPPADTVAVLDECFVIDACIDRYLWALYQRTPKEDSIKVQERRAVSVKRRGKTVTVMRSFTKLVDEDFAWKDPKAADHAGMSMMDYVIGGMDRSFKRKLFRALLAAEAAGLSPGITSAFRDDYRQSIASGLKAASDRSYHGGSFRGGYGHGLAADVVSTKGDNRAQRWTSTEVLWKWIDANGKALGIGRPYLDRDPPHVGPIDGQEYISRRGTGERQIAANAKAHAASKKAKMHSARERSSAKPQKSARASKGRTI